MERLVLGSAQNGIKTPLESLAEVSTTLGDDALRGQRISAGEILSLADICAGRCAFQHLGIKDFHVADKTVSVATVAVDAVSFRRPVYHGEYVRLEGRIINVGNSSMAVRIECCREITTLEDFTPRYDPISVCIYHMVCIDKTLRPANLVPALEITTDQEKAWSNSVLKRRKTIAEVHSKPLVMKTAAEYNAQMESFYGPEALTRRVTIPQTLLKQHRVFFPAHVNINNTVFGGEIMHWMERCATQCARRFCNNDNVHTFSMSNLTFKKPIFTTDWVRSEARVIYLRSSTVEVQIDVYVERGGETFLSHSAFFVLASFSGNIHGAPREVIKRGLKVEEGDTESLQRYGHAVFRYEWSCANREDMFF